MRCNVGIREKKQNVLFYVKIISTTNVSCSFVFCNWLTTDWMRGRFDVFFKFLSPWSFYFILSCVLFLCSAIVQSISFSSRFSNHLLKGFVAFFVVTIRYRLLTMQHSSITISAFSAIQTIFFYNWRHFFSSGDFCVSATWFMLHECV